jgi:NADPH-dependent 2,4-dienoyl-CoA reductase/sulfur reductase-like enzyme
MRTSTAGRSGPPSTSTSRSADLRRTRWSISRNYDVPSRVPTSGHPTRKCAPPCLEFTDSQADKTPKVVIIGAGPAGLTAAYELAVRYGITSTVLEADSVVGGISRTVERDGWRFDIGGHRFFTKVKEVEELWHEILPDEDFMLRPRMSRIYYDGKYYDYPLKA